MLRARASGAWSPTELPSRTLPRRLVVPLANSSASSSVVLPERYGPTRATTRGALGIGGSSTIRGTAASIATALYDRIVARPPGGGKFLFGGVVKRRRPLALSPDAGRGRKAATKMVMGRRSAPSAAQPAAEDCQQQQRDDVGDLD